MSNSLKNDNILFKFFLFGLKKTFLAYFLEILEYKRNDTKCLSWLIIIDLKSETKK